jgi:hypothetical protein
MTYRLQLAAYIAAVTAIACAVTWAASFLPVSPTTGQAVCIVTGAVAVWLATAFLPCPTRKERP